MISYTAVSSPRKFRTCYIDCKREPAQVMHDSALAVRRPGECTFFNSPGCELEVDKVEFTPEMVRVRARDARATHHAEP